MGRFIYDDRLGQYGLPGDFIDDATLTVLSETATSMRLEDSFGAGFSLTGTGLTYDVSGNVTGGVITGFEIFDSGGGSLITGDRLSANALALVTTFNTAGLAAALFQLMAGRDLLIGSSVGDLLQSGGGNDTIRGGGGADILNGMRGNDVLVGGTGADHFVFLSGGTDHILDFHDLGLRSDDRIDVTSRMYHNMVVTETLTGVELDFGARGTLVVDGWHAADIGRDDFLLV
jgi:Ca2+-binding RTX toxin-like protein